MAKVLVVIVSSEDEKINLALNFAKRQSEAGHDIRVMLFGPSEARVAGSEDLLRRFGELGAIKPKACVYVAKGASIEDRLSRGFELLPAGGYITKSIEEGFGTITF
jgi:hypothetical protein